MRTLTITLHDTENCGSSLQAYALQKFLFKKGIDNEIIDYVPDYTKDKGNCIKYFLRNILFFKASQSKKLKFQVFKEKYLKVTEKHFASLDQLEKEDWNADCFITGSDQLWNDMYLCGQDPAFYLKFTEGAKIAYGVSMGRDIVPEKNRKMVLEKTYDFKWISFREHASVQQFENQTGCLVDCVCDPVLLNDITEYDDVKAPPLISEPYILVYIAQHVDRKVIDRLIESVKILFNGKVVFIGAYRNKCICDMQLRDIAPDEFLSLIENAQYVISNSFHATLFSLMYKKQFMTIVPQENGERIKMILDLAGIPQNAVSDMGTIQLISPAEYDRVEERLKVFSIKSQQLLIDNLWKIYQDKGNKNDNR